MSPIPTTRHIPLDGTPNLRDLGGYATRCGQCVATGKAFRSGTLAYLSASDWRKLEEYKLSVICDFRREDEQAMEPTTLPPNMPVNIVCLSIGSGSLTEYLRYLLSDQSESADSVRKLMQAINREFVLEYADTFRQFMQHTLALADHESILFHCSAGKDRTGFGAALLLSALNVERDVILNDYLASADYYLPTVEIEKIKQRFAHLEPGTYQIERLQPMLEVQADYLNSAFAAIDENWGDSETYIREALNISDQQIQHLRSKFLVPAE